ncbi:glyceraldehyde 3-phosphate dehydrogenase NAD-binding domain-containing protein [uncultured Desulfosarcina sp.]|uniref:glyceraldehyde 3-phosphate dehydrogenase NAD-binding domain-containing protein n=1 Tax=uncultured Desulfosarcina sp. TaxID=218289 RepID=UPI0029C8EF0A|nr:glyceraldehyde 3-phosphate dehydrogenase NAD-binding domain-containing protein [uncultured Desulfosarcina sp.]
MAAVQNSPVIRCAINGFGRIGRGILRALYEYRRWPVTIVAINDLAAPETVVHLTRFDSTHGRFPMPVREEDGWLWVGEDRIRLLRQERLSSRAWEKLEIDVVLECTGRIKSGRAARQHLDAGAGKVLISNPADDRVEATIVYGLNHNELTGREAIVSNASCTSNCVIPVIEVLDRAFGIACGNITTIHAAMNDQPVIDCSCSNLRLCRAAGVSIVPVDTRLDRGIERILPRFAGRFQTTALRVPTLNVTAMDLHLCLERPASADGINAALKEAADSRFSSIMDYCDIPVASIDFNHDPHSCIVDATQTRVCENGLTKLLVWCDNEWGFANRMLDTVTAMMKTPA